MIKSGKVWGETVHFFSKNNVSIHRLEIKGDSFCSKHCHEYKYNLFYVESGHLTVKVWKNDYDLVDETILGPGEYTKVKPGVQHQFECLEDAVAYELYWAEFPEKDIVRETVGHDGTK